VASAVCVLLKRCASAGLRSNGRRRRFGSNLKYRKENEPEIVPIQPSGLKRLEMAFEAAVRPSEQVMPPESTWSNRWRRWRKKNHDFRWWVVGVMWLAVMCARGQQISGTLPNAFSSMSFTTDDGTSQSVDAAPPNYNLSYQNTGWSLYIKLSWGRLTTHTRLGLLLRDRGWERSF